MVTKISLIDYLKTQSEIYCECPFCEEVFRLNEARLTYGKAARKDLLDRLRMLQEEINARILEERTDAQKRSRATSKGLMLEHIFPYLPAFSHNPRDARFLGDPIDFVVFDGLFAKRSVSGLSIIEVKSGVSNLTETEKSIKRAVDKGRVNFEILKQQ